MNYANGSKFIGKWKNNEHHGKGIMTYFMDGKSAGKFIGEFKNGKSYQGKIILPDGSEMVIDKKELGRLKKEAQQEIED